VLPDGVDTDALRSAQPFAIAGTVVLAVDRLHRLSGVRRAIAAMPSLDPEFRLVVVGDGPQRDRLAASAADLGISSRVQFVGAVSDAGLYRWLRTARVVVTLAGERGSGSQLTEGLAAGASVVASDLPIHREVVTRLAGGPVVFVPPKGSPLDVADAIDEAARVSVLPSASGLHFTAAPWASVVDSTWTLYRRLMTGAFAPVLDRGDGALLGLPASIDGEHPAVTEAVAARQSRARARSGSRGARWQPRRRRRDPVNGGRSGPGS
jgi:glycosyltransferase involved in cell wall biosynthesis